MNFRNRVIYDWYHYSFYWGIWSRVLRYDRGEWVVINLMPIPSQDSKWNDIRLIRVRRYCADLGENDLFLERLPSEVMAKMVRNLGENMTDHILTGEFLDMIDLEKFNRMGISGAVGDCGANLVDILKTTR